MAELEPMARYAKRVARGRCRCPAVPLTRRLGGPLVWKYLDVVPSVFTGQGEFSVLKLLVPVEEVIRRLGDSAVLTLDSATERLAGFRSGRGRHIHAYFAAASDLDSLVTGGIGQRIAGDLTPLLFPSEEQGMLLAVVCEI